MAATRTDLLAHALTYTPMLLYPLDADISLGCVTLTWLGVGYLVKPFQL